eukprot:4645532-Amphidinium_carterae.1
MSKNPEKDLCRRSVQVRSPDKLDDVSDSDSLSGGLAGVSGFSTGAGARALGSASYCTCCTAMLTTCMCCM